MPSGFWACSDATIDTMLRGGQWNEPAQVGSLAAADAKHGVDLVTITAGGNDVWFATVAEARWKTRNPPCKDELVWPGKSQMTWNDVVTNGIARLSAPGGELDELYGRIAK